MRFLVNAHATTLLAAAIISVAAARADENGNVVQLSSSSTCSDDWGKLDFICNLPLISSYCTVSSTATPPCGARSQEMYTSLSLHVPPPAYSGTPLDASNTKPVWTGYGANRHNFMVAPVCLLLDLKTDPIDTEATASLSGVGDFTVKQHVGLLEWNKSARSVRAYQRAQVCAPMIGCVDAYQQQFKLTPHTTIFPGPPSSKPRLPGAHVGGFPVADTHGIEIEADYMDQKVDFKSPPLGIKTPYGNITIQPKFGFGRNIGWTLSPFAGPVVWGNGVGYDLYGRSPGLAFSQYMPMMSEPRGWVSQVGLGNRAPNPAGSIWIPGISAPLRPDTISLAATQFTQPRSAQEKIANAQGSAAIPITYTLPVLSMSPWMQNHQNFVKLIFGVHVTPSIEARYSSQLNLWSAEIAHRTAPDPDPGPNLFQSRERFEAGASAGAYGRFKVDAGIDLTVKVNILTWKTLVDVHPNWTLVDKSAAQSAVGARSAWAESSYPDYNGYRGRPFEDYHTLSGVGVIPQKHLQACSKRDSFAAVPPASPTYTPGDANDVLKATAYPCNVCVYVPSHAEWVSVPRRRLPKRVMVEEHYETLFPSTIYTRPIGVRTLCGAPPGAKGSKMMPKHAGCFDSCSFDQTANQLTVLETAREMYDAGKAPTFGICNQP